MIDNDRVNPESICLVFPQTEQRMSRSPLHFDWLWSCLLSTFKGHTLDTSSTRAIHSVVRHSASEVKLSRLRKGSSISVTVPFHCSLGVVSYYIVTYRS